MLDYCARVSGRRRQGLIVELEMMSDVNTLITGRNVQCGIVVLYHKVHKVLSDKSAFVSKSSLNCTIQNQRAIVKVVREVRKIVA